MLLPHIAAGQQPEVVALAAPYVRLLGPVLLLWSCNECLRAYFSAQGVVLPLTLVAAGYTALMPLANWLCIYRCVRACPRERPPAWAAVAGPSLRGGRGGGAAFAPYLLYARRRACRCGLACQLQHIILPALQAWQGCVKCWL